MTGKEVLDDYKDFGKIKGESITSNQTNEWKQKYFEEIEEVNLRADMLCAWNDELENKLSKYKRAFEILNLNFTLICKEDEYFCNKKYYLLSDAYNEIKKEEAELLEELMKDE